MIEDAAFLLNKGNEEMPTDDDSNSRHDTSFELRIREIATIQARLTSIELINEEIRPEIKELAKPKWGAIGTAITVFLLFMGLLEGLNTTLRTSDYAAINESIKSIDSSVREVKSQIKDLRDYVDMRNEQLRSSIWPKDLHDSFDRQQEEKIKSIEDRLLFLEHPHAEKIPDKTR